MCLCLSVKSNSYLSGVLTGMITSAKHTKEWYHKFRNLMAVYKMDQDWQTWGHFFDKCMKDNELNMDDSKMPDLNKVKEWFECEDPKQKNERELEMQIEFVKRIEQWVANQTIWNEESTYNILEWTQLEICRQLITCHARFEAEETDRLKDLQEHNKWSDQQLKSNIRKLGLDLFFKSNDGSLCIPNLINDKFINWIAQKTTSVKYHNKEKYAIETKIKFVKWNCLIAQQMTVVNDQLHLSASLGDKESFHKNFSLRMVNYMKNDQKIPPHRLAIFKPDTYFNNERCGTLYLPSPAPHNEKWAKFFPATQLQWDENMSKKPFCDQEQMLCEMIKLKSTSNSSNTDLPEWMPSTPMVDSMDRPQEGAKVCMTPLDSIATNTRLFGICLKKLTSTSQISELTKIDEVFEQALKVDKFDNWPDFMDNLSRDYGSYKKKTKNKPMSDQKKEKKMQKWRKEMKSQSNSILKEWYHVVLQYFGTNFVNEDHTFHFLRAGGSEIKQGKQSAFLWADYAEQTFAVGFASFLCKWNLNDSYEIKKFLSQYRQKNNKVSEIIKKQKAIATLAKMKSKKPKDKKSNSKEKKEKKTELPTIAKKTSLWGMNPEKSIQAYLDKVDVSVNAKQPLHHGYPMYKMRGVSCYEIVEALQAHTRTIKDDLDDQSDFLLGLQINSLGIFYYECLNLLRDIQTNPSNQASLNKPWNDYYSDEWDIIQKEFSQTNFDLDNLVNNIDAALASNREWYQYLVGRFENDESEDTHNTFDVSYKTCASISDSIELSDRFVDPSKSPSLSTRHKMHQYGSGLYEKFNSQEYTETEMKRVDLYSNTWHSNPSGTQSSLPLSSNVNGSMMNSYSQMSGSLSMSGMQSQNRKHFAIHGMGFNAFGNDNEETGSISMNMDESQADEQFKPFDELNPVSKVERVIPLHSAYREDMDTVSRALSHSFAIVDIAFFLATCLEERYDNQVKYGPGFDPKDRSMGLARGLIYEVLSGEDQSDTTWPMMNDLDKLKNGIDNGIDTNELADYWWNLTAFDDRFELRKHTDLPKLKDCLRHMQKFYLKDIKMAENKDKEKLIRNADKLCHSSLVVIEHICECVNTMANEVKYSVQNTIDMGPTTLTGPLNEWTKEYMLTDGYAKTLYSCLSFIHFMYQSEFLTLIFPYYVGWCSCHPRKKHTKLLHNLITNLILDKSKIKPILMDLMGWKESFWQYLIPAYGFNWADVFKDVLNDDDDSDDDDDDLDDDDDDLILPVQTNMPGVVKETSDKDKEDKVEEEQVMDLAEIIPSFNFKDRLTENTKGMMLFATRLWQYYDGFHAVQRNKPPKQEWQDLENRILLEKEVQDKTFVEVMQGSLSICFELEMGIRIQFDDKGHLISDNSPTAIDWINEWKVVQVAASGTYQYFHENDEWISASNADDKLKLFTKIWQEWVKKQRELNGFVKDWPSGDRMSDLIEYVMKCYECKMNQLIDDSKKLTEICFAADSSCNLQSHCDIPFVMPGKLLLADSYDINNDIDWFVDQFRLFKAVELYSAMGWLPVHFKKLSKIEISPTAAYFRDNATSGDTQSILKHLFKWLEYAINHKKSVFGDSMNEMVLTWNTNFITQHFTPILNVILTRPNVDFEQLKSVIGDHGESVASVCDFLLQHLHLMRREIAYYFVMQYTKMDDETPFTMNWFNKNFTMECPAFTEQVLTPIFLILKLIRTRVLPDCVWPLASGFASHSMNEVKFDAQQRDLLAILDDESWDLTKLNFNQLFNFYFIDAGTFSSNQLIYWKTEYMTLSQKEQAAADGQPPFKRRKVMGD